METTQEKEKEKEKATLRMVGNKHETNQGAVVDLMLASLAVALFGK